MKTMKPVRADFHAEQSTSVWRPLTITVAVAIMAALLVVAAVTMSGCKPGWNDPTPILKEEGNPCGTHWHSCKGIGDGDGKCCPDDSECRPAGYCAYGGLQGPTWGASKDGGAIERTTPQLTPSEVRRLEGWR